MSAKEYTGNNVIFIVGCPRSGTTWIQQLLASYPKAKTGPESYLFSWFIGPQLRAWRREMGRDVFAGVGLGGYFREDEFLRNLKLYMSILMQPMIGSLKPGEVFIEKTPNHALFVPEIIELLPDCKIVHILRDARDTVASLVAASKTNLGKGWASESAKVSARVWVKSINAIQAASKNLPKNRLYEIRYEKLKASPESELSKLSQFLSFDWDNHSMIDAIQRNDPKMAKEAGTATGIPMRGEFQVTSGRSIIHTKGFVRKAKVGSWKEDLSSRQKLDVWRVARRTMAEVGYQWKYPW